MSDLLSDWQDALIALLKQPPPDGLGITVIPGQRDGISKERDIACVFSPSIDEYNANINYANPQMTLRVWRRFKAEPKQDKPQDPKTLYRLRIELLALLQPVQNTLLEGRMYFRVTRTRFDHPALGLEMSLLGWAINAASLETMTDSAA